MILAATQIYGSHGGIQSYMRRLSEVLSSISRQNSRIFSAVSLLDNSWNPRRHARSISYHAFAAANGSRGRFVRQILELCMCQPGQPLILGHVALAPIAYALRRAGLIRTYIVVLHGVEAWKRLRMAERVGCRSADRIVATTQFTRERFCRENGLERDRVSIVPLAIERANLEPPSLPAPDGRRPLRVLFVGRLWSLERYKGVDELIEAIALLQSCEPGAVQLEIVGEGDDLERLKSKTQMLQVNCAVTFSGALNDSELAARYRACDLFALPSKAEGFGIVFLEAMSYGKPCVAAASGGAPEVIANGRDGFLVPYGDVAELASCLRMVSRHRGVLGALGERAYQKVSRHYLFGNMLDNWSRLLFETGACP